MTQWYQHLSEQEQELVRTGWGSREFADWTATFLLSMAGMALKSRMPPPERQRLNMLLTQRYVQQHRPGHQPDFVERLYNDLHRRVSSVVQQIDDRTGHRGGSAVSWLDREIRSLQEHAHELYERLTRGS